MVTTRQFPTRDVLRRPRFAPVDVVVALGMVAILFGIIRLGAAMGAPSRQVGETVSTATRNLPYYAARSLLRMFIALGLATAFTFVYGTAAARSRRWRVVLIPFLDILQSVPILGFLSITVTFFLGLFPGSTLGLEFAAIFAIFTSQAWNMTFSFYHSLITQPAELDEAARMFRLTKWERFWRLDVPSSMIGLVWNGMMSFGGGWFFLAASEAITISSGKTRALPGIGSYVAVANQNKDLPAILLAILVMVLMVVGVNTVFWRPLVAWSEKFRVETSEAADAPRSVVLSALRRSSVPAAVARPLKPVGRSLDNWTRPFGLAEYPLHTPRSQRRAGDVAFTAVVGGLIAWGVYRALAYFHKEGVFGQFPHCLALGAITLARVVVLVIVGTLIWVPIGVKIGMSPKLSRYAQPIVQVLASFPAILLFPLAIVVFQHLGVSLDYGGIVLMALGSQWYILFNVIAGASAIPTDMREMADQFRLPGVQKWREVILPAIFPFYVTGGITAAGGAWNASIVAEYVLYGKNPIVAHGLGAYITESSLNGQFARVLTGVVVMSFYVVVVNRLVWRPLYHLAEVRYSL
jgi:NitT/TauT family transport system permease protein